MKQRNSLLKSIAFLFLGCSVFAQQTPTAIPEFTKQPPLWKVDLRKFGAPEFFRKATPSLTFTDAWHIALSWFTVDKALQKAPGPIPAHFNVLVFDATNGTRQSDFGSVETMPIFFGLPDGGFVLCAQNSLKRLSPDFKIVRQADLSPSGSSSCESLSPDSRSVLLSNLTGRHFENQALDVESLQVLHSWTTDHPARGISGDWALELCPQPALQDISRLTCIRQLEEAKSSVVGNNATFVGDGVLMAGPSKTFDEKRC